MIGLLLASGNNNDGGYARQQADYFKMYTIYCSNHPTAVDTKIKLAKKNSNFRKFLAVRPAPLPFLSLLHARANELTRFNLRAHSWPKATPPVADSISTTTSSRCDHLNFSPVMMVMLTGGGRIVMLTQPVQRICKYPLFLRVRYTTTSSSPRLPPLDHEHRSIC